MTELVSDVRCRTDRVKPCAQSLSSAPANPSTPMQASCRNLPAMHKPGTQVPVSPGGIFMQMQNKTLAALIFATMLLQACNQQADTATVDAAKVQADVTKADADGQKTIIDAQAKLDQVVAQNNKDLVGVQADAQKDAATNPNASPAAASADIAKARANAENKIADAQYDVDRAKAGAVEKSAEARCENQVGDANKLCVSNAKTSYDSALATAKAKNDAVHAANK
jgi:hypothetical protein